MQHPTRATLVLAAVLATAPAARAQHAASAAAAPHAQGSPAAPALDDPTIVAILDAANAWDVETGTLALRKSRNAEVRRFADMMVRDHGAVRQLGRDLATKLHVTPTPPGADFALAKAHAAAMRTLQAASGPAFDRAYADHEAAYHQAVIDAMTTQLLPATQNAELRALEIKVAPNFEAHLAAAKALQRTVGSSKPGNAKGGAR